MRQFLLPLLLGLDLALAGVLAWQWVTPQGELKSVRWSPPAPIKPDLSDAALPSWSADAGNFIASLDRPLFSSTRKPPAPPKAEAESAPAVVADTLADVRILGLYASGGTGGGAIVRSEGKVQRIRHGDSLAGWTVKEIRKNVLVMARGGEVRALEIKRGPDVAPEPATAAAGGPAASAPTAGTSGGASPTSARYTDRRQQEADASRAAVNAMRARAGMPPLP